MDAIKAHPITDPSIAPHVQHTFTMLRTALVLALIISACNAQFSSGPPPIGPLSQFTGLGAGNWQDLSLFGFSMGISTELLSSLADLAKSLFSKGLGLSHRAALPAAGGFGGPPPLPPLPKSHKLAPWSTKHDMLLRLLAEKWSGALIKAQVGCQHNVFHHLKLSRHSTISSPPSCVVLPLLLNHSCVVAAVQPWPARLPGPAAPSG